MFSHSSDRVVEFFTNMIRWFFSLEPGYLQLFVFGLICLILFTFCVGSLWYFRKDSIKENRMEQYKLLYNDFN